MSDEKPEYPNLKPFKPGVSGNAAGRPKGALGRAALARKYLDARLKGKKDPFGVSNDDMTIADMMILALINKGQKGDINAIRELLDSGYGKNADVLAGDPDAPINNNVNVRFIEGAEPKQGDE